MKHLHPYTICDIHLENGEEQLDFLLRQAHYCLFWWKQIPLGQLFTAPGIYRNTEEFREAVLDSIDPAITFYAVKQGINPGSYRSAFLSGDQWGFAAAMDSVLGDILYLQLPGTVDVSVIICTRNRADKLQRCLEMLLNQRRVPGEIIVVDNAPQDGSTRFVVSGFPTVRYHLEPKPGLDIARNAGARLARCPVLAYVDDDVLVHPDWAYRVWEAFRDPQIDAITGLVIASALETESQLLFEKYWSFNRGYRDRLYDGSFIHRERTGGAPVWEIGAGANMAFRKGVFEKAGYFDERLDVGAAGCSGDSEMWFRMLSRGMRILYTPRAVVYHEHRAELRALRKQLFYYMRGFTAAALIQHGQDRQAGYVRHFYRVLAPYYLKLLKQGLPSFRGRHRTVFNEISGIFSGTLFYLRNRHRPAEASIDRS